MRTSLPQVLASRSATGTASTGSGSTNRRCRLCSSGGRPQCGQRAVGTRADCPVRRVSARTLGTQINEPSTAVKARFSVTTPLASTVAALAEPGRSCRGSRVDRRQGELVHGILNYLLVRRGELVHEVAVGDHVHDVQQAVAQLCFRGG